MSISSRMFSTQYSLVALEPGQNREDFVLYAAGSFPPLVRSDQARDLLAYICNMSPENLTSNPQFLKPSLLFFTGEALDHLLTDCIETIGEDVLAQALDKAEGNKRPVGSAWFPLHLLSFCASYVSVSSFIAIFPTFLTLTLFLAARRNYACLRSEVYVWQGHHACNRITILLHVPHRHSQSLRPKS